MVVSVKFKWHVLIYVLYYIILQSEGDFGHQFKMRLIMIVNKCKAVVKAVVKGNYRVLSLEEVQDGGGKEGIYRRYGSVSKRRLLVIGTGSKRVCVFIGASLDHSWNLAKLNRFGQDDGLVLTDENVVLDVVPA